MFNATFLEELMRPQEVYTSIAARQVFDKLAHTSIMRLNENSMDKVCVCGEGRERVRPAWLRMVAGVCCVLSTRLPLPSFATPLSRGGAR